MSQIFSFQSCQVRTSIENNQVWFVAKDVCAALAIPWNGSTTLQSIPKAWQGVSKLHTPSGKQALIIITEPAVYKLAFRSNKPEADAFTNWVASEVLPAIRQAGGYSAPEQLALPAPSKSKWPDIWRCLPDRDRQEIHSLTMSMRRRWTQDVEDYILKLRYKTQNITGIPPQDHSLMAARMMLAQAQYIVDGLEYLGFALLHLNHHTAK